MPQLAAAGVLFYGGYDGAQPAFVQNHNTAAVDVPLSVTTSGGFAMMAAPLSDALVPGRIQVYVRIFDAAGARQLGVGGLNGVLMFDESGWSSNYFDYAMVGGCVLGHFSAVEPGGPFVLRMEAVDEANTNVYAEVLVQPSCSLANGSSSPEPTQTWSEQCLQHCPGF